MSPPLIRVCSLEEIQDSGHRVIQAPGVPILVLWHEGKLRALDNRCPHMGFPMHKGDVKDGLIDCHWHHARFDVSCGATLDPWADDLDAYRVSVIDGDVFVDPTRPVHDPKTHGLERLGRGLEHRLRLVSAKSVIQMDRDRVGFRPAVEKAAIFGATQVEKGWQPGLSILAGMVNLVSALETTDQQRAMVHSMTRIATDCGHEPPRRPLPALEQSQRSREGLAGWLRECVEVRDADGAERVLAQLVEDHGAEATLDAVLTAVTDHRYADTGHMLDYTLKCAELVDAISDSENGAQVHLLYTSLVPQLVGVRRMEETPAWRRPVDVAALVDEAASDLREEAFARAGRALETAEKEALVTLLLGEDPRASLQALLARLRGGVSPVALCEAVIAAATRRVLAFGTANEHSDWDTVHHTLTYANAVAEGLRRVPSPALFRGVLDAAMSVYLDRFLNVPPARLPEQYASPAGPADASPEELLALLEKSYDGRAAVDEAGRLAWRFLEEGGKPSALLAALGTVVLREDVAFHEMQQLELCWRRLQRLGDCRDSRIALVATARWLAAQFPTRRAREQTFQIAQRLERGEALYEDDQAEDRAL